MFRNLVFCIVCAAVGVGLAGDRAAAAEIHVPADHETIQAAIEASQDGDVVIVSPGTYPEHINFLGKAITVRSTDPDDPNVVAATIIDGGGEGSCVIFENGEGPDSILAGLAIINGNAWAGGGITCHDSSPMIVSNLIASNSGEVYGGGIACYSGAPMITNNTVIENSVQDFGGGIACCACDSLATILSNTVAGNAARHGTGIYCQEASPVIAGNIIIENRESGPCPVGGGIYSDSGSPTVANNLVAGNSGIVGGMFYWCLSPTVTGNDIASNTGAAVCSVAVESSSVIAYNTVTENGGGVTCSDGALSIVGNMIANNTLTGGITVLGESPIVANNLIAGNTAAQGGGIRCNNKTLAVIANNTIVNNRATEAGGGVYCNCRTWPPTVTNCIVRNNTAELGAQIAIEAAESGDGPVPSILRINRSDVEGGRDAAYIEEGCTLIWDEGNIDADPLFIDPGHWDDSGTPGDPSDDEFILGDYHLLPGSPCIDAGTNDVDNPDTEQIEELPETDFAGLPRIIDGDLDGTAVVDMGAYEYLPGDVNYDGKLNVLDLIFIRNNLGADPASVPAARQADLNADGKVDVLDLVAARNQIERR